MAKKDGDHYKVPASLFAMLEKGSLAVRRMIDTVVTNLIENSQRNIEAVEPKSIEAVREHSEPLVVLSDEIYEQHVALKRFLNEHLYSHEKKLAMTQRAQTIIRELFEVYMSDISQMPTEFELKAQGRDADDKARVVADYIAGMTDRYAIAEHERVAG